MRLQRCTDLPQPLLFAYVVPFSHGLAHVSVHVINSTINIWATTPQNQHNINDLFNQWKLRSAWASVRSDQSFRYPFSALQKLWSDWTDARLMWVFAGRTCHFVGFVIRQLKFAFTLESQNTKLLKIKLLEKSYKLRSLNYYNGPNIWNLWFKHTAMGWTSWGSNGN